MDIANLIIRVTNEGLDRARADLDRLRGSAGDAEVRANKLKDSLGRLAKYGAVAFVGVATAALKTADSMQNLNNKIRVATDGIAEYSTAQKEIERIAMGTYSSLESVGELYASNERALGVMGKTQREVLGFTENITKAMAVSGGSAQAQAAALTQLGQAMASGTLRGDEFNSIAEQAPVLLELLSDKLGMTTGELRAFAAEGGITSEVVYDAISGATDKLDGLMGQTTVTMGQGLQNIKTQWSLLADSLVNTEGGIGEGIANSFNTIAEKLQSARVYLQKFFSDADNIATFNSAIEGLKNVWDNLVSVIQATADVIAPVIEFFREHDKLSEALAISIGLVGGAFVVYNAAVAIGTAVTGGFVVVLALLTSPITLTIAALVALTAAGVYLYRNWDEIKAKGAAIWQSIKDTISNKVEAAKQALIDKWSAAKTATVNKFNEIKTAITTALRELPSKMLQIGKDIVQGLINGIKSGVSGVTTAIGNMASSAVAKAKSVLDIRSPSRVMKKVGEQTAEGMAVGIKKGAKAVKSEAQKMAEQAIETVKNSVASLQKEIALFGNDSPLASFNYDVGVGKFAGVPDSLLDKNRELIAQKMRLIELDKQQAESVKLLAKARESIQERFAKLKTDQEASGKAVDGVMGELQAETAIGKIQADYERRIEVIRKHEELTTGLIGSEEAKRLAIYESAQKAKELLQIQGNEKLYGELSSITKTFFGEQSAAHRAMFAIEKYFALKRILVENKVALAKAWASASFPYNLPAVATVAAQTGLLATAVKGFKQGGYTGNMGASQVAGVVHGQEYVFDAQSTKRIGVDNLNAMRRGDKVGGDVQVNIINNSSARVTSSDDGKTITIEDVRNEARNEIKRSWTNTGNPNSFESKQLNRNIQAPRRR